VKLIAGLGNPGEKYRGTRHNVGFAVVDELARRAGAAFDAAPAEAVAARWRRGDDVVLLVKPLTFMNLSGQAIGDLLRFYKVPAADLLVICDDVHLPLGRLRIRGAGTEGGHNGLKSVAAALGTLAYARLRIGVGRGDLRRDLADHVLARFEADERDAIAEAIPRAADAAAAWLDRSLDEVMNLFNRDS
jgi:PTH1 family peptidyl-tRNA hydrolase